jgi:hypothetical protein
MFDGTWIAIYKTYETVIVSRANYRPDRVVAVLGAHEAYRAAVICDWFNDVAERAESGLAAAA